MSRHESMTTQQILAACDRTLECIGNKGEQSYLTPQMATKFSGVAARALKVAVEALELCSEFNPSVDRGAVAIDALAVIGRELEGL